MLNINILKSSISDFFKILKYTLTLKSFYREIAPFIVIICIVLFFASHVSPILPWFIQVILGLFIGLCGGKFNENIEINTRKYLP